MLAPDHKMALGVFVRAARAQSRPCQGDARFLHCGRAHSARGAGKERAAAYPGASVSGLSLLGGLLSVSLRGYPVDGPLPDDLPPSNQQKALRDRLVETAKREKLTIRQLYTRQIGSHGVYTMSSLPIDIADEMEQWFREGGADGFNIMASGYPGGFTNFVNLVVPELRHRGLVRNEYPGRTLRQNMSLPRPEHPARASGPAP
jgi:alkanesulfonate monooxygenase SsuD/methylene tetrahydromethanopterin reductase-like flavin-dependent oxidoreductase (luciferase family)